MAPEAQEAEDWQVGGRYKVGRGGVTMWSTPEADAVQVGVLSMSEEVLLISISKQCEDQGPRPCVGLVVPQIPGKPPGWIALEDPVGKPGAGKGPLVRRRLEGSWEMKARYSIQSAATLRKAKSLASEWIGELEPGEEVLALELGFNQGEEGQKPRLRMKVSAGRGEVGWISPETASGHQLLCPVNLLSPKVVDIHRRSLSAGRAGGRMSFRLGDGGQQGVASSSCGSPAVARVSYRPGGGVPWQVGCQYRVLERVSVREQPSLASKEHGRITAGSLVSVLEVQAAECPQLGLCPCALVSVDEGPEKGRKGWVRCAAKDGHDQVDTRDQLEYSKVRARLEMEEQQRLAALLAEQEAAKRAAEEAEQRAREQAEREDREQAERKAREQTELQQQAQWRSTPRCTDCMAFLRARGRRPKKLEAPAND